MGDRVIGYVLLTKRSEVDEPLWCEHIGPPWPKDAAIAEGIAFVRDNPESEYVVAAVVTPEEGGDD